MNSDRPPTPRFLGVALAFGVVFAVVLIRTAWVSDDAYITFRSIDNWLGGYGLRWNPIERVQAYTHPLWMLSVSAAVAISGEFFYTSIALGIVFSLAALGLLCTSVAFSATSAALALTALLFSRAFVDYSTSGLENALSHLLFAVFAAQWAKRGQVSGLVALGLTAGLAATNRLDAALLYAPPLLALAYRGAVPRAAGWLALGFAPLLAWEIFSIVYYGFAFPNTAYAKLATGVPRSELIVQGLRYLLHAVRTDPITPGVIAAGVALALTRRGPGDIAVASGIALQLAYGVAIGGDFMAGRFLSLPVFAAAVLLARGPLPLSARAGVAATATVATLGLLVPNAPPLTGADYGADRDAQERDHGISDERRWYYPWSGMLRASDPGPDPENRWVRLGRQLRRDGTPVARFGVVGFLGYFAGPRVHIVDHFGLADPLLARLPAKREGWRIGHFRRRLPPGYIESVGTDANRIGDPATAALRDDLVLITRGPIFTGSRWRAIGRVNLGRYDRPGHVDSEDR